MILALGDTTGQPRVGRSPARRRGVAGYFGQIPVQALSFDGGTQLRCVHYLGTGDDDQIDQVAVPGRGPAVRRTYLEGRAHLVSNVVHHRIQQIARIRQPDDLDHWNRKYPLGRAGHDAADDDIDGELTTRFTPA
jgi:hypothetical protein